MHAAFRRLELTPFNAMFLVFGMALLAGLATSRIYWGYWTTPPAVDSRLADAGIIGVSQYPGAMKDARSPAAWRELALSIPELESDAWLSYRAARLPSIRAKLEDRTEVDAGLVSRAVAEVRDSRLLERGKGLYQRGERLNAGLVIDARGSRGERLLFVSAHGGEVSNDHYPIYEWLFEIDERGWRLLDSRRMYEDVAGIEGARWFHFAGLYFVAGMILIWPLLMLAAWWWRARRAAADSRAG